MAFSDPIVGTEVLIRNQIQSENFSVDPEQGVTGWQIKRDGTATFNNIVVGGANYAIDQNGNGTFEVVSANTDIILAGESLSELLNSRAKGLIKVVQLQNASATYDGTNERLVGRTVLPQYDVTREYLCGFTIRIDSNNPGTGHTFFDVKVRYAWDADPTQSSPILYSVQQGGRSTSDTDSGYSTYFPFHFSSAGGTDLRLGLFLNATNANARLDGTAYNRIWLADNGAFQTYDTYDSSGGGGTPPTQYVKTYGADWSESYQSDGTSRGSFDNGDVYQGYYSGTNGNQFSLIGFPYTTIQNDLSGATINKVEVYLDNKHWYQNAGGTAIIGYHNNASAPGTASYPSGTDNITRSSFTYGQAKWVTVNNSIGNAFKNNTAKGILLGKGQTSGGTLVNDNQYYGYFVGANKTGEPKLRITYTK